MGLPELFLTAVGLSMDAFAVSICKGLKMQKINYWHMSVIAFFFGGFQAAMPLAGWILGRQFAPYITNFDHWVTFFLLLYIGGKMIWESCRKEEEDAALENLDLKEVTMLAVATSVDALAVGITFAFLKVKIISSVLLIGITTLLLSCFGVVIGNRFGSRYKEKAEIAGGLILICIGTKILLEHLGIFPLG